MKFYDFHMSTAAYRVRTALILKNIEAEQIIVDLVADEHRAPWFEELNPQRLLPILEDGDTTIAQSLPIIEYLEETCPEPALLPSDAASRAWVRSFAQSIVSDIHPLNGRRVRTYLAKKVGVSSDALDDWYKHWIAVGLSGLEGMLSARTNPGPFCCGDAPTIADICLVPQIYNAQRFGCDTAPYPTILDIVATCSALPAFVDAVPERQPDWKPMEGIIPGQGGSSA